MTPRPEWRRLGGLDTLVVSGAAGAPVIAMFHGYGADANDLAPLSQVVRTPAGTTWLFPNAPHEVAIGPHMTGRAWFPIDMEALQIAMMSGRHRDMSDLRPPELAQARAMAMAMLADFGAPIERVILAGFSQGAMLATALALHADRPPLGLAILSGTMLDREVWQRLAPQRSGLRFFQSHGTHDPLLDFHAAERLHAMLNSAGLQGEFMPFRGQHEIPMPVLDGLSRYLGTLAPADSGLEPSIATKE